MKRKTLTYDTELGGWIVRILEVPCSIHSTERFSSLEHCVGMGHDHIHPCLSFTSLDAAHA